MKAYGSDQGVPRLRDRDPDLRRRGLHEATTPSSSTAATRRSSASTRAPTTSRRWTSSAASSARRAARTSRRSSRTSAQFVQKHAADPTLGGAVKTLASAQEALGGSAMRLLSGSRRATWRLVPLHANRFLEMMSETAVAWLLLEGAAIAIEKKKGVAAGHPDARVLRWQGRRGALLRAQRAPGRRAQGEAHGRRGQVAARHSGRGVRDGLGPGAAGTVLDGVGRES